MQFCTVLSCLPVPHNECSQFSRLSNDERPHVWRPLSALITATAPPPQHSNGPVVSGKVRLGMAFDESTHVAI